MLDNWYFGNPINQLGKTLYGDGSTTNKYYIDRWVTRNVISLSLQDGFIRLWRNRENYSPIFGQPSNNILQYAGKTLTISTIYRTSSNFIGVLNIGLGYSIPTNPDYSEVVRIPPSTDWNIISYTMSFPENITGISCRCIQIMSSVSIGSESSNYVDLMACKVELGTEQTLAYQDSDGNWQLYEIPDYSEELLKCQRYMFVYKTSIQYNWISCSGYVNSVENGPTFAISLPTILRINTPTVIMIGKLFTASVDSIREISSITWAQQFGNSVRIRYVSSDTSISATTLVYGIVVETNINSMIILDANLY